MTSSSGRPLAQLNTCGGWCCREQKQNVGGSWSYFHSYCGFQKTHSNVISLYVFATRQSKGSQRLFSHLNQNDGIIENLNLQLRKKSLGLSSEQSSCPSNRRVSDQNRTLSIWCAAPSQSVRKLYDVQVC